MNEVDRKIAEEIDDEALLRLAEGDAHTFSPEYQKKMERLYKKSAPKAKRKMTPLRRFVAVAAIVALLTGTAAATTFWEEIQQFFVTTFGRYVELRTGPNEAPNEVNLEDFPDDWESFWYPDKYLEGYSLFSTETLGERKVITLIDGEERLQFSQWPAESEFKTDNDGNVVSDVYIGDSSAYAIEKMIDGMVRRSINWIDGDVSFRLYGSLSFDELCDVANNLVYIER